MARSPATVEQLKQPTTEIKNENFHRIKLNKANLQIKTFPRLEPSHQTKNKRQCETARRNSREIARLQQHEHKIPTTYKLIVFN